MRKNYLYIVFSIIIFQPIYIQAQISSVWNRESSIYYYKFIDEKLDAEKVTFDKTFTREQILDSLASFLTVNYFVPKNKYYQNKAKISINIDSIMAFNSTDRQYRIAVVNIQDFDKICMTLYFQGSSGGQNTYIMLVSNLMQPQLKDPLLDGIIFLYNNSELKGMDHINLSGIISERGIDFGIREALEQ
ncbi:MAG: hypothetical protein IH950_07095 [Bacteroidetes bacterium]|nr:hypothetical protein [Bacteroidota bacterium]